MAGKRGPTRADTSAGRRDGQLSSGGVECSARTQDDTNVAGSGKAETVHVLLARQCTCVLRGACISAQAGASCKQVGCGEERKQRVEAAHCIFCTFFLK